MVSLRSLRLSFLMLTLVLLATPVLAQNGRISGVVRDSGGAPREGVTVRATNTASGATRAALTDVEGRYALTDVPSGTYTVTAAQIGFRRATRADIKVDQAEVTVDLTLETLPLQAITVTATLREEELADVPFSVAAPTATLLRRRGADNIEGIAANVAGFSVQNLGPGQSQVAIRGASAGQIARDQPGVKEQAGVYLDDTPISLSLFTPDLDLFDVSRVEVLRGPQGTLFGSGSLAGTVRYITNQPELGVSSTFGEIGSSRVFDGGVGASIKLGSNISFGDKAGTRVALYHNQLAGYMDAVQPTGRLEKNVNSGTRTGVRVAVRWEPNAKLIVTPRLVYQTVRMDGWNRIDAFNILANPYTTTRRAVTLGERELFTQIPEPFTDDYILGDLNLKYELGRMSLSSITSYAYRDILVVRDAGALTASITGGSIGLPEDVYTLDSPLDDATKTHVLTQEVRLAGGGGRARWLLGGFLSKNDRKYGQSLDVDGFEAASGVATTGLRAPRDVLFYSDLAYDLTQTAVFGEATFSATPKLDLTAGLRYYNFDEDRDQVFDGIFANDNTGTSIVSVPGSTSADGFAPRFIASFKPTPRFSFNAQVSRGFRLGGINDPLNEPLCTAQDLVTFGGRDSWDDETAWNYEVGAKTVWMNGRTSLNLSAFHMDIRDLQLIVTAGSCSSRLVFNVPKSVSQGLELELTTEPNRFVDLALSGTLNNAELKSTLTSTSSTGEVTVVSGIEEGNRLPSVPKLQATAAVTFHRPVTSTAEGFFNVTYNHVGSRFTQIDDMAPGVGTVNLNSFAPNTIGGPLTQATFTFDPELPAYNLLNLRLGLSYRAWEAAIFLNNLTDERALLALDRERGLRARVGYLTNQPRTLGVNMSFSY